MDNPMRDVVEQMKASAQREGKQQTSPQTKAAMERRRLRERLDMAHNSNASTIQSLIDAEVWSEKPMNEQILGACREAQTLGRKIERLLREVQGE